MHAKTLIALALAAATCTAQAHHVWIEQDAQGATLYFGEFGGNLREASPGLLDKFVEPTAQRVSSSGASSAHVQKTAHGFAIDARAGQGESLVAEDAAYPVTERKDGDKTTRSIYVPAARLVTDFSAQPHKLTLDLVPTGQAGTDGVEFQAFYKGQPLPKANVEVVSVAGWGQARQADDAGKVRVTLPWRGTYVLELSHRDSTGGERANGDKWDRASYVTSLTVSVGDGLPALPAPPAAAPNK
jgi:uncharacterized GH25 family protein